MVPVLKSDDKEITENFRGKSLLCVISKVLHVFSLFSGQKLYHLQEGFVKGSSCVTSLRSAHDFAKALYEKKQLVFLDYCKAFDSITFRCLLKTLFSVGTREKFSAILV